MYKQKTQWHNGTKYKIHEDTKLLYPNDIYVIPWYNELWHIISHSNQSNFSFQISVDRVMEAIGCCCLLVQSTSLSLPYFCRLKWKSLKIFFFICKKKKGLQRLIVKFIFKAATVWAEKPVSCCILQREVLGACDSSGLSAGVGHIPCWVRGRARQLANFL